jgi:methionyl-tRNA synthetase
MWQAEKKKELLCNETRVSVDGFCSVYDFQMCKSSKVLVCIDNDLRAFSIRQMRFRTVFSICDTTVVVEKLPLYSMRDTCIPDLHHEL